MISKWKRYRKIVLRFHKKEKIKKHCPSKCSCHGNVKFGEQRLAITNCFQIKFNYSPSFVSLPQV